MVAIACVIGSFASLFQVQTVDAATIYAVTGGKGGQAPAAERDAESVLYRIDQDSGVATLIGSTGITQFTSLAFDPTSGMLYGHQNIRGFNPFNPGGGSAGYLHRIDPATGATTQVAATNSVISDLSFDSAGRLVGWMQFTYVDGRTSDVDQLLRIDKSDGGGITEFLGGFGSNQTGLAFTPNGNLFIKSGDYAGQTNANIGGVHQIDPLTGLPLGPAIDTLLGPLSTLSALSDRSALTVVRDASDITNVRSALGTIDLETGAFTQGSEIVTENGDSLVITALAVSVSVPEPSAVLLTVLGSATLLARRRRLTHP
jgi:hypothetical protein